MCLCRQGSTGSTFVLTLHVFLLVWHSYSTRKEQWNHPQCKISKVIVNTFFLVFGSPNSDMFVGLRAMRDNHSGVDSGLSYLALCLHQFPITLSAK